MRKKILNIVFASMLLQATLPAASISTVVKAANTQIVYTGPLTLYDRENLYNSPDDNAKTELSLSPQTVTATNKTLNGFYEINTWIGIKYIKAATVVEGTPSPAPMDNKTYSLELSRWGIYNDATHPTETTDGINKALQWAHETGYTVFKVPAGTYLIAKGAKPVDPTARINMVSNMTFWLDDSAVIQKETNGYEGYETLYIGDAVKNTTLKGGTYQGDKLTHNYSGKDFPWSYGTHEGGMGIVAAGAENIMIDGVKSINYSGDSLCICGNGKQVNILYQNDFESGSIDDAGNLINNPAKIRTKTSTKTKFNFSDPIFQSGRVFEMTFPVGTSQKTPFHVYFYKADGTFISSIKNQELMWSLIEAPIDANYFQVVLDMPSFTGIQLQFWNRSVTRNSVIKNSEFAFSRRQGITVGGADNVLITNNKIHDIKGTAPMSGIDLEGGTSEYGNRNTNIFIKSNNFYNNEYDNVILYDGENVTVEDNYLGTNASKGSVGVAVSSPFRTGALIKNNIFDGSTIASVNDATFIGNHLIDSLATIEGKNVTIDGMTFTDSSMRLKSYVPNGIAVSNITMTNSKNQPTGLEINGQPIHLSNVTINGQSSVAALTGDVADGSVFDNLKIMDFGNGLNPPPGTYNNCQFEGAIDGNPGTGINKPGHYEFNNCTMKAKKATVLTVNSDNAYVTVKNSVLDLAGTTFGNNAIIYVTKANTINLLNNTLSALGLTETYIAGIKINNYGAAGTPAGVLHATITGNTITTTIAAIGISTIDARTGAPPYIVQNNTLNKAKLELKSDDINIGNVEK